MPQDASQTAVVSTCWWRPVDRRAGYSARSSWAHAATLAWAASASCLSPRPERKRGGSGRSRVTTAIHWPSGGAGRCPALRMRPSRFTRPRRIVQEREIPETVAVVARRGLRGVWRKAGGRHHERRHSRRTQSELAEAARNLPSCAPARPGSAGLVQGPGLLLRRQSHPGHYEGAA